jgi:hypothetical protein
MSKLAALGRRHFVGIFAAAGARPVPCETAEAFDQAVEDLIAGETPTPVFVDQHFAGQAESLEALRVRGGAAALLLPAGAAEGHPALDEMRAIIELAAGANILGEY